MLEKRKIAGLIAMTALVAACGGGGGGDGDSLQNAGTSGDTVAPPAGNTDTPPTAGTGTPSTGDTTTPPAGDTNTPPTGGTTNPPPVTENPGPGTEQPGGGTNQPADTRLAGRLSMVANQLVFLRTDRSIYNAFELEVFESGTGLLDAAAGSTSAQPGGTVPPSAVAPAAPIAAFGFRIDRFVQQTATETAVGGQTVVGRVAFNLVERADSPVILVNEVAEQMSFVIDGVELSTSAAGELIGVRVRDDAQMHVYGRNSAGVEVRESIPAASASVRLLPVSEVLDNYGDTSSTVLLFDLEHAFSQAGTRLSALENIAGHFDMDLTLSAARIVRPAEAERLAERELTGKSITVNGRPAVEGTGISGTAWIRAYPS